MTRLYHTVRCRARNENEIADEGPLQFEPAKRRAAELQALDRDNDGKTSSWSMTLYFPELIGGDYYKLKKR
jgi:hypothetical protein|tara:strand:+ start:624 stop:836 length:213 start_codon:yes stop_codon:yes gene_type:complete